MVDQFDPHRLRLALLQRVAEAEMARQPPPPPGPGLWTLCTEELRSYVWPRAAAAAEAAVSDGGAQSPAQPRAPARPCKAIRGHICASFRRMLEESKVMCFMSFPQNSIFRNDAVEQLFQRHHTQPWGWGLDWPLTALLGMMVWDFSVNPGYRVTLVGLFYGTCLSVLPLRKALLMAAPPSPGESRRWHVSLLCFFFIGRCTVCQPLFSTVLEQGAQPFRSVQSEALNSVIGLGMTNLSMVFMRLQTVDTLCFCIVNGAVFVVWIIFVLRMPLTDALHMAYVSSVVVMTVCVRSQHDMEAVARKTFELQLLQTRGVIARSGDLVLRQSTASDFALSIRALRRARQAEHLNL